MIREKIIHARIDNETHNKLVEKCNEIGCTFTEYIDSVISESLEDDASEQIEKELDDLPSKKYENNRTEEVHGRKFNVTLGRLYENEKDIGSSLNFDFRDGKVYDKKYGNYLGYVDNKEPYWVYTDE